MALRTTFRIYVFLWLLKYSTLTQNALENGDTIGSLQVHIFVWCHRCSTSTSDSSLVWIRIHSELELPLSMSNPKVTSSKPEGTFLKTKTMAGSGVTKSAMGDHENLRIGYHLARYIMQVQYQNCKPITSIHVPNTHTIPLIFENCSFIYMFKINWNK